MQKPMNETSANDTTVPKQTFHCTRGRRNTARPKNRWKLIEEQEGLLFPEVRMMMVKFITFSLKHLLGTAYVLRNTEKIFSLQYCLIAAASLSFSFFTYESLWPDYSQIVCVLLSVS
jgi:hypothetical protein